MTDVVSVALGGGLPTPEQRQSPLNDQSVLELLRHGRHQEALARIASNKEEVNAVDDGSTPLLVATTRGWGDVVEALIKNGANVNVVSELGETPLMRAIKAGKIAPGIIKLMLDNGASETLNHAAKDNAFFAGWTALHFACDTEMNHSPVVIALLVAYGADTKAVCTNGKTPGEICAHESECVKALSKPREYLKNHVVSMKMPSEDADGRGSLGESMDLGSETSGHDESKRTSLLHSALHMFKPKKSSLIQQKPEGTIDDAGLPPTAPAHSIPKAKPKVL